MADQADVYVNNQFTDAVHVVRYLPRGGSDLEVTILSGNEEKILLPGTDVYLVINAPGGVDIKNHKIIVTTGLDLAVSCSRTNSNWTIQIIPNSLPPEVPTTVNVEIGAGGP